MKPELEEPSRLRDTEDGALLRASDDLDVPAGVQARVRVALAEKLETRRPAWILRTAFGLAGVLVVGGALAAVLRPFEPKDPAPKAEVPVQKPRATAPRVTLPVVEEVSVPAAPAPTAPVQKPIAMRSHHEPAPPPEPVAPPEIPPPVPVAAPAPAPAPAHLRVEWQGRRQVDLEIRKASNNTRIVGTVNGVRVDLRVEGALLYGHLDEETIHLVLRGLEAGGTARGHETGFSLIETERGLLLRGTVPSHTVRVELEDKKLSWFPGCENELRLREPGVFSGTCVQNRPATVVLPKVLWELPPLVRMILLGLVLTERDPEFDSDTTRLFPPLTPSP